MGAPCCPEMVSVGSRISIFNDQMSPDSREPTKPALPLSVQHRVKTWQDLLEVPRTRYVARFQYRNGGGWHLVLALLTQRVKIDDNCCKSSIVLA
jgi:hypothetical protein